MYKLQVLMQEEEEEEVTPLARQQGCTDVQLRDK